MDTQLKQAVDTVMDSFDDAVIALPGVTKQDRVVALARELQARITARLHEVLGNARPLDEVEHRINKFNHGLMEEDPTIVAVVNMRVHSHGYVVPAVTTKGLSHRHGAQYQMACTEAVCMVSTALLDLGKPFRCGCKTCRDREVAAVQLPYTGPKAEA
ncbi:MAG: hypothetical protein JNL05_10435 [Flavobacteriales bacterium]|nr:hypothetical protein [Flavobacteriales bacterium]